MSKRSSVQQFRKSHVIIFVMQKIWSNTPTAAGSYGRLTCMQATEQACQRVGRQMSKWACRQEGRQAGRQKSCSSFFHRLFYQIYSSDNIVPISFKWLVLCFKVVFFRNVFMEVIVSLLLSTSYHT